MTDAPLYLSPLGTHAFKVARWLRGTGVEIGAFKSPLPGIKPFYVDRFSEYAGVDTRTELIGAADALPFRDHTLDYVASSHVLEHVANPIKALVEWVRVLRHRGIIYLVVPDRRSTWDHLRPLTTVEHLLRDFEQGVTARDDTHVDEFVENIDWTRTENPPDEADIPATRRSLRESLERTVRSGGELDMHFHVFEPGNLLALIERLRIYPGTRFDWEVVDLEERFPRECPNGIFVALEVRQPPAVRFAGWRARRLTRLDPLYPVAPDANWARQRFAIDPSPAAADSFRGRRETAARYAAQRQSRSLARQLAAAQQLLEAREERLAERDHYVHQLHLEKQRWGQELEAAREDVATFGRWLLATETVLERSRAAPAAPGFLRRTSALRTPLSTGTAPAVRPAQGDFIYYLYTSPFRVFRQQAFTLHGWLFPRDRAPITGVQAWVDESCYPGTIGLEDAEVARVHNLDGSANARPAFKIDITVPEGRHELRIEAAVAGVWWAVLTTPVWMRTS